MASGRTTRDMLRELSSREPIFHRPEHGTTRAAFEAMTAPDYWEVGASGRRYDREEVWAALAERYADPGYWDAEEWEAGDFACRDAGEACWLVTYTLRQGDRVSRRLTVWRRSSRGWQALYHQGTLVADAGPPG